MKRKCVLLILALVVVFGSVSVASAYAASANVHTNRTSNTSADVIADISYGATVDSCTIKMTLQEKYNGSWRTATGVPVKIVSKTEKKKHSFALAYRFTLVKGKVYRIKAQYTSSLGTSTTTLTRCTGSF